MDKKVENFGIENGRWAVRVTVGMIRAYGFSKVSAEKAEANAMKALDKLMAEGASEPTANVGAYNLAAGETC